jgi:hypothetical protein
MFACVRGPRAPRPQRPQRSTVSEMRRDGVGVEEQRVSYRDGDAQRAEEPAHGSVGFPRAWHEALLVTAAYVALVVSLLLFHHAHVLVVPHHPHDARAVRDEQVEQREDLPLVGAVFIADLHPPRLDVGTGLTGLTGLVCAVNPAVVDQVAADHHERGAASPLELSLLIGHYSDFDEAAKNEPRVAVWVGQREHA